MLTNVGSAPKLELLVLAKLLVPSESGVAPSPVTESPTLPTTSRLPEVLVHVGELVTDVTDTPSIAFDAWTTLIATGGAD